MTWSELFFDLIFVTGVRRLGELLREGLLKDSDAEVAAEGGEPAVSLFEYSVLFLTLWALWWDQSNYGTRWGTKSDPWNFVHYAVYMVGVVGFVVSISHLDEPWGRSCVYLLTAVSYGMEALSHLRILCFHWSGDDWRVKVVRQYAMFELIVNGGLRFTLCTAGVVLSGGFKLHGTVVSPNWAWPLVGLALVPYTKIIFLHLGTHLGVRVWLPYHIEHVTERISLLMIIYLGDGVDNLAARTTELPFEAPFIIQFTLGFALLLGLKLLLLDSCEVETSRHAIRRSVSSSTIYFYAMPVQAFGLALTSSGLALLLGSQGHNLHAQWGTELLCDGIALVFGAFVTVGLAHSPPKRPEEGRGGDPRSNHFRELLVRVWRLQLVLNLVVLAFCVVAPRLAGNPLYGKPATLLCILSALVYVLGMANLLDEAVEGRLDAITPPEERERESFEESLAALTSLVRRSAALRNEALEAIKSVPPAQSGISEPLLM